MWWSLACEYSSLVAEGLFLSNKLYWNVDWGCQRANVSKSVLRNRVFQCLCENNGSFKQCWGESSFRSWACWGEWAYEADDSLSIWASIAVWLNYHVARVCESSERSSYNKMSLERLRGEGYDEYGRRLNIWWFYGIWGEERGEEVRWA